MDQQQRMLLAMVLSAVVIFGAEFYFQKNAPPPAAGADGGAALVTGTGADGGQAAVASTTMGGPSTPSAGTALPTAGTAAPLAPVQTFTVDRDLASYTFSNEGGGLTSAEMRGAKMREQDEVSIQEGWARLLGKSESTPPPMNLALPVVGDPLPLSVSIAGDKPFRANTRFNVEDKRSSHVLVFTGQDNGWEVTKTFAWEPIGYEMSLVVTVKNLSNEARNAELALHTVRSIDPIREQQPSFIGGVGNQSQVGCAVGDDYKHELPKNKPPEEHKGPLGFFGIDQQYFLTAIYPLGGAREGRCVLNASASQRTVTGYFPVQLGAGQSITQRFGVFMGPKDSEALADAPAGALRAEGLSTSQQGAALASGEGPHLERAIDFGMWAALCKALLWALKALHKVAGNWGITIVLLTAVVRLALSPVMHRQMISMEQMKVLQPKIEKIKKDFPDDKERQQQETMKVYQEAKVNPFGSCLLLIVQMPIWFALYRTLRNSYEIYREPFFGHVWTDLTYKDPTYILPVLLGISQFITTRLQPQTGMDPAQQRMMNWFMPVMFTVFLINNPMGLTLYIFTSNVLTVAQQYASRRIIAARKPRRLRRADEAPPLSQGSTMTDSPAPAASPAPVAPGPDKVELARTTLLEIFSKLGSTATLEFKDAADGGISVAAQLAPELPGLQVGRRSPALEALQFLANKIVNRPGTERRWISVGIGQHPEPRGPKPVKAPQAQPAAAPPPQAPAARGTPPQSSHPPKSPAPVRVVEVDERAIEVAEDPALRSAAKTLAQKSAQFGRFVALVGMRPEERAEVLRGTDKVPGVGIKVEGEGRNRRVVFSPDKPTPMPKRVLPVDDIDEDEDE